MLSEILEEGRSKELEYLQNSQLDLKVLDCEISRVFFDFWICICEVSLSPQLKLSCLLLCYGKRYRLLRLQDGWHVDFLNINSSTTNYQKLWTIFCHVVNVKVTNTSVTKVVNLIAVIELLLKPTALILLRVKRPMFSTLVFNSF